MNTFINFDALSPITTMNPRSNYDLRISRKTNKITLSDAVINRLSLEENGLNVYAPQQGKVIVSVQPNEQSSVFSGKANAVNKSRTFKADALFNLLKSAGSDEFNFVEAGSHNGITFYTVEPQGVTLVEEDSVEQTVDSEEEFAIV
jgi:beta-mannanase